MRHPMFPTEKHRLWPVLLCLLAGCGEQTQPLELAGTTMGTYWRLKIPQAKPSQREFIEAGVLAQLEEINSLMSNWAPDSDISRFNRHEANSPFELSAHTTAVLALELKLAAETQGQTL